MVRIDILEKDGSLYTAFEIEKLNKDGSFPSIVKHEVTEALEEGRTVAFKEIKSNSRKRIVNLIDEAKELGVLNINQALAIIAAVRFAGKNEKIFADEEGQEIALIIRGLEMNQ